jgi:hypothetical protein
MTPDTFNTSVSHIAALLSIGCVIYFLSSMLAATAYLSHERFSQQFQYKINRVWLLVHAASALVVSIAVTVWLSIPVSPKLPFVYKHCHGEGCGAHIPSVMNLTSINLIFALFVVSVFALFIIVINAHQTRLAKRITCLMDISQGSHNLGVKMTGVTIISTPQPVMLNVGLISPKILLSSHIVHSLHQSDVNLLLAYEYGKAKQFENLKIKLLQITCLFWPTKIRIRMLEALRASIHERVYLDMKGLQGDQIIRISSLILRDLSKDIRILVERYNHDQCASIMNNDSADDNQIPSIFHAAAGLCYFLGLFVITSNVTHVVFELFA